MQPFCQISLTTCSVLQRHLQCVMAAGQRASSSHQCVERVKLASTECHYVSDRCLPSLAETACCQAGSSVVLVLDCPSLSDTLPLSSSVLVVVVSSPSTFNALAFSSLSPRPGVVIPSASCIFPRASTSSFRPILVVLSPTDSLPPPRPGVVIPADLSSCVLVVGAVDAGLSRHARAASDTLPLCMAGTCCCRSVPLCMTGTCCRSWVVSVLDCLQPADDHIHTSLNDRLNHSCTT